MLLTMLILMTNRIAIISLIYWVFCEAHILAFIDFLVHLG